MQECTAFSAAPTRPSHPRRGITALSELIATWRGRRRFRRNLEEMVATNPHLADDIGMRPWQVEAEIAKPFWRA